MTKPFIVLPCTARDLETALHAVCDHDGLWDAKIGFFGIDTDSGSTTGLCLMLDAGATKHSPLCERGATEDEVYNRKAEWCSVCDRADCPLHGHDNLVICKHFHESKGETK